MNCSSNESDVLNDEDLDLELEAGVVFTRLSEVVRKQYSSFLEKLLKENYDVCCNSNRKQGGEHISACAELLEDKALKSCMMVQIYRKAMIKIIASVRHSTKECRLQHHLRFLIEKQTAAEKPSQHQNKSTQTESVQCNNFRGIKSQLHANNNDDNEFISPSLQRKMEMFQTNLNNEIAATVAAKRTKLREKLPNNRRKHSTATNNKSVYRSRHRRHNTQTGGEPKPTATATRKTSSMLHQSIESVNCYEMTPSPKDEGKKDYRDDDDDVVAKELAQLFSEERNEIDAMFGFDDNLETDDPQINNILKEIENAQIPNERKNDTSLSDVSDPTATMLSQEPQIKPPAAAADDGTDNKRLKPTIEETDSHQHSVDLRNSLWPCELYMQRRNLSEALSRLIEEDFRWHEIMRWKFMELFGEDSDDEFASYSPSIELNEVLVCSCVKRISPWVVKHLMKPMNDGLIANRFLFKKLAKKLARLIIMENQYPGEKMIKTVVENFFCIRQAVLSVEDLDLPFIIFDNDKFFDE